MYILLIYNGQYRNWTLQNKNLKSLFQNSNKHILICSVNYSITGMSTFTYHLSFTLIELLGLGVNRGPLIRLVNSHY